MKVSIIIPCRNEERYIGRCLDSIIIQDYLRLRQGFGVQAKENLEVLVVDGDSQDKTKEIVGSFAKKYQFIRLLDNLNKFTSFGLNIGIKEAKGKIIIRMDAHAGYEKDYISKCVKYLEEYKADNVGGVIKTVPANNSLAARAIALCLSGRFGAASDFRIGSKEPRLVDTVFGGCYRREVFEKIGYFDERMVRSQDIEFNKRLASAGGKILLVPEIVATYYPQATFSGFVRHNFTDGFWVTFPLRFGIGYFSTRHLIPLFFVLFFLLLFILGIFFFWPRLFLVLFLLIYLSVNFTVSLFISLKKGLPIFPFLMTSFFIRHFIYGLGSIIGLIKAKI